MRDIDKVELKYKIWNWAPRRFIRYSFSSFVNGVKNLKVWFPLIWKDRDWDYAYLEDIIRFKLHKMHKFFDGPDPYVVDAKNIAKEIEEAYELLTRVHEDIYLERLDPNYWKEALKPFETIKVKENGQVYYKLVNEQTEEEKNARLELHKEAYRLQEEDRKRAYQIISEKSREWWD